MTDGVPARDVYQHAVNFIKEKDPELEKFFVKNIGFAVSNVFLLLRCGSLPPSRLASNSATLATSFPKKTTSALERIWFST